MLWVLMLGGTFTDLVAIDEEGSDNRSQIALDSRKPGVGVVTAIEKCAVGLDMTVEEFLPDVLRICHGTTVEYQRRIDAKWRQDRHADHQRLQRYH